MKTVGLVLVRLVSSLTLFSFMYFLYGIFMKYDWGHPWAKLGCFAAFFVAIAGFYFLNSSQNAPRIAYLIETGVFLIIFLFFFSSHLSQYGSGISQPPWVDIGYTTVNAATLLVRQGENPYSSQGIGTLTDYGPEYRGFYYGPVMMAGYLPAVYFSERGFKFASVVFVLVAAILIGLLVIEPGRSWAANLAGIAFAETAYILPEVFWRETLAQGATDILPIMLLLGALLALKRDSPFWAGLFTGLSFCAKFAPALFLVPFSPVREKRFWLGFAAGLLPLVPFALWDLPALFRNFVWLRVILKSDSTSLYSVLPDGLHWLMPLCLLAGIVAAIYWNVRGPRDYRQALVGCTLLLIVASVTSKEMHLNHLIWFFPLFAVIFTYDRERLAGLITGGIPNIDSVNSIDAVDNG